MTHVIWDGEFKEIRSLTTAYPFSNGGFAVPLPGENILCFLYGLQQVFEMSGGVPRKMRFDNLSAAVVSIGKNGQRGLCEQFQRFMLHYRFEAEFCNPGVITSYSIHYTKLYEESCYNTAPCAGQIIEFFR